MHRVKVAQHSEASMHAIWGHMGPHQACCCKLEVQRHHQIPFKLEAGRCTYLHGFLLQCWTQLHGALPQVSP
jgi:hypothetical protein